MPVFPPLLKIGDRVALIATSGGFYEPLEKIVKELESWGLIPVVGSCVKSNTYFSGTDDQRHKDLNDALSNSKIRAIFCLRGGYGLTRIIDNLSLSTYKKNPKWIIGFSDITALHLKLQRAAMPSVHGPMARHITESPESADSLKNFLFTGTVDISIASSAYNKPGSVKAPITGGNLSLIADSLGTSTPINTTNKILLIEEIGEPLYKIDRMLTQLKRVGIFSNIKGLIVGYFTNLTPMEKPFGQTIEEVILSKIDSDMPVAFNFPVGHETPNICIPFGVEGRFSVGDNSKLIVNKNSNT